VFFPDVEGLWRSVNAEISEPLGVVETRSLCDLFAPLMHEAVELYAHLSKHVGVISPTLEPRPLIIVA
jgi:hypothetical protein